MGDKPQSEKFRAFRLTMRFVVCALCLMLSAHPAATQVVANPISGCSGNTALFNPAQGQDIVVPVEFTVSVFAKGLNFPTGIAFLSQGNGFEVYVLESGHGRSEEHTSELQSRVDLVCRLLLEKKKKK